ncbi:aspartyl/asparaginyl beta-hydroxylase isoform X3 [Wyeomyia smithii]|uniref:aspartyl/asparaginyl beta-hydroxylase isoform X3 n=1 Tax=Wyeomyia smithii TaxID=174621 RepID=UPI002467B03D|nr:aspartyl/asparaginyl beta-hydroxylase isoform X3 [Wyeomyia smithii]
MSGDVQPRKRKDKKRKKDDEDAVKEAPSSKQSAGAAQAATQPGDIQMHIHSDHGTGGNWCAKIVFFFLLVGLGALIGLILIENRGVSNGDTPLSESRYAEYFSGWVDENREDDHHHEDILNALNQLEEEHEDDGDGHGADDDHEPYTEEEDHDDEQEGHADEDDDADEEEVRKLDDEEVEEIVAAEKKFSQQEATPAEDDDEEDGPKIVDNQVDDAQRDDNDDNDATDDPVDEEGEQNDDDDEDNIGDTNDYDDDDDDDAEDEGADLDEAEDASKQNSDKKEDPIPADNDDDDDNDVGVPEKEDNDADAIAKEIENIADANDADDDDDGEDPFDEEANKLNLASKDTVGVSMDNATAESGPKDPIIVDQLEKPDISGEILKSQMDDLVENYNKLAEMLNVPKEEFFVHAAAIEEDENDDGQVDSVDDDVDDRPASNSAVKDDIDDDNDDDDDDGNTFENFVDNDGGEEEYLAKVRQEQELKNQRHQQQAKEEPREETSLAVQIFVGVALIVAAHLLLKPPRAPTRSDPAAAPFKQTVPSGMPLVSNLEEKIQHSEVAAKVVEADDFVNQTISYVQQPVANDYQEIDQVDRDVIEENVPEDNDLEQELYSGDEDFDYEQEEYIDELEEIEEEEEEGEDVGIEFAASIEEKKLEEQEREIGTFVPTTFEEFSAMYRSNTTEPESTDAVLEATPEPSVPSAVPPAASKSLEAGIFKNSPLAKKKPPKGAVNKLIYGLHKEPLFTAEDLKPSAEKEISSRPSAEESYQEELDRAKRQLDEFKDTKAALQSFEALLIRYPRLVPALVGKARTLDLMAEQQQSNTILEEAVEAYRAVLALGQLLDDDTLQTVAERCINRIRFSGHYLKAVDIHQILVKRFDSEPRFRNQLAVTYLMANRLAEAKAVLHETLLHWIEDGFALVHYGFVVKNLDKNMELAAQYLQEGIETGHEGTQDGRFYFHLGDALQRLGRNKEALNVYREGANKKLFLSMYQRSLYNEDNLKSRPFWTVEQTTYGSQLELIRLQWSAIRDEGLRLLNAAGNFKDEAENLRDTGDWKQFELFSRGYRIDKNCAKAPLTCKLIEQFRAARSCKRGQVKFSVMHPGTHVWPHCGPTNCRIRAHLGLKVPSGTHIRVAEETRSWKEGEWLIFDDSYEHEVWHNGTSTRLVLIVDFWHPELSESQRRTLSPI